MSVDTEYTSELDRLLNSQRPPMTTNGAIQYLIFQGDKKGCPCKCHRGVETYHMIPCHNPIIMWVGDVRLRQE